MSRRSVVSQQKKNKSKESSSSVGRASAGTSRTSAHESHSDKAAVSVLDTESTTDAAFSGAASMASHAADLSVPESVDSVFAEFAATDSRGVATDCISAIEAAEEIIAQAEEEAATTAAAAVVREEACEARSMRATKTSKRTAARGATRSDVSAESSSTNTESLRTDLRELGETLRNEFKNSINELQAAQAAGAAAQSEVLRTLTEMIFQTAGSQELSAETVERAFSGIEDRLLARIQAVTGGVHASAVGNTSQGGPSTSLKSSDSASGVKLQNAATTVNRSWEQIRNEMMSQSDLDETSSTSGHTTASEQLHEVSQLSSDRHFKLPEQDPSLEIPRTVDPETLSDHELRDAFRARETFITTLIARIRRQQEQATGQLSPEQLRSLVTELPEELASQVRHTLKQMEDLARMGELELSLERARIARQVNQLEHTRQLIERNARQLGLTVSPDGTISGSTSQPGKGSSSRRWLGKLGFGQ